MKQIYTLLLLLFATAAQAQVPNSGFENWTVIGGNNEPDGWISPNPFTSTYGVLTCEPGTPGYSGTNYVALTSQLLPGAGITVPGAITTGDLISNVEGYPYNLRPVELNGWWQHQSNGLDQGLAYVALTKWNTTTQQRDDIGAGYIYTSGNISSWTFFSVPIFYVSPDYPDTATITLSSSGTGVLQAGSTLWVDDLGFDLSTSIAPVQVPGLDVFLASEGQLRINADEPMVAVGILGMDGREMLAVAPTSSSMLIDISALPAGCYLACARFHDGSLRTHRFVKD